jgi:hypothetical protein
MKTTKPNSISAAIPTKGSTLPILLLLLPRPEPLETLLARRSRRQASSGANTPSRQWSSGHAIASMAWLGWRMRLDTSRMFTAGSGQASP